ncbi:hypothetical protein A1O1_01604 [Capronia coronata CBS 617.96]|uniref:Uncharacterized protein n=1 Tax=Capronia coronata CBS 617.96 TaxID=1182541 RepID=W9YVE4_9EURO|nr:uncharacterized protein A1O1_01604 [Capronia coronata CBS 617.96]EXJ96478.1 hypothetical protein A1O1_01604 [Capronia coronata CBS 617.96]
MLAARDQENLVHACQTAAAGKPLNQGLRALHPKTPGGLKTPFRVAPNDENRPLDLKGQKTVGKGAASRPDKNSFVTPLAPRNRAPLGAKTTNAKAQVFQTPAPVPLTSKQGRTALKPTTARRSGRSKIAIAPAEQVTTTLSASRGAQEEEPDYGYAPPPPADLPDPPLEFSEDHLLTEELSRSYGELYSHSQKDENGSSLRMRKEEDDHIQHQRKLEEEILDSWHKSRYPTTEEMNAQVDAMIMAGPQMNSPPISRVDTMNARSAVAALSELQPRLPAAAMKATQASEQKKKRILPIVNRKHPTVPHPSWSTQPGRAASQAAVSKNTIGFPKARKAPSIVPKGAGAQGEARGGGLTSRPKKISQSSIHPKDFRDRYGSPPVESDMWFRLKEYELLEQDTSKVDGDEPEGDLFDTEVFPFENTKLNDDDFQLPMPE